MIKKLSENVQSGQFASIYDVDSNRIILSGKILQVKYCIGSNTLNELKTSHILIHKPYITFDYRYFFHFNSKKYLIAENALKEKIDNALPSRYIVDMWTPDRRAHKDEKEFYEIDVFKEFTKSELDPEICPLVTTLNKIGFVTTSSCCGHYSIFPHVIICIDSQNDKKVLEYIVNGINNKIGKSIVLLDYNCEEFQLFNSNFKEQKLVKLQISDKSSSMEQSILAVSKMISNYEGLV